MATSSSSPEHQTHAEEVQPGSNRAFGLVFAAVFAVIAVLPLFKGGEPHLWALVVSALFLAAALTMPDVLRPLNRAWFKIGLGLHAIVNPIVMGLLFFAVLTPIGLLMRATGKDPLHRRFDKETDSYWIRRTPPGPAPESMKNQF